ncbi:MAG: DUF547 domain-containing protein [Chitinivibrionales bacterium]|nr:DUF547 domain-containing protein [Chitinivibrionales bacterium]
MSHPQSDSYTEATLLCRRRETMRRTRDVLLPAVVLLAGCHGTLEPAQPPVDAVGTNLAYVYEAIDTLFGEHVTAERGLVDYDAVYADPLLQRVRDSIATFDLSSVESPADSLALLINAYNIAVIYHLRDYGFDPTANNFALFNSLDIVVAGQYLTLDELEKTSPSHIKGFDEPRTHFALVCAALSCPPLMNRAYRGDSLWVQLDRRTTAFLNDSEFTRIDPASGSVQVSRLFQWYANDFAGFVRDTTRPELLAPKAGGTVADFVASYITDPAKAAAVRANSLQFLPYDWTVNRQ